MRCKCSNERLIGVPGEPGRKLAVTGLSAERPSELMLAAQVARQFYLRGVSKVDIADQLGISRFRVARLLDAARRAGLVRIEIGLPGQSLDVGLSDELCSALGLRHAFV